MKHLFTIITVTFLSLLATITSYAAPIEILQQILANKEVIDSLSGTSITHIQELASFKCLGCYRYEIEATSPAGVQKITVETRAHGAYPNVSVRIISRTN